MSRNFSNASGDNVINLNARDVEGIGVNLVFAFPARSCSRYLIWFELGTNFESERKT